MNFRYFDSEEQIRQYESNPTTPTNPRFYRGFARIAEKIVFPGKVNYAPQLIGPNSMSDIEELKTVATTFDEAKAALESWAAKRKFLLKQID